MQQKHPSPEKPSEYLCSCKTGPTRATYNRQENMVAPSKGPQNFYLAAQGREATAPPAPQTPRCYRPGKTRAEPSELEPDRSPSPPPLLSHRLADLASLRGSTLCPGPAGAFPRQAPGLLLLLLLPTARSLPDHPPRPPRQPPGPWREGGGEAPVSSGAGGRPRRPGLSTGLPPAALPGCGNHGNQARGGAGPRPCCGARAPPSGPEGQETPAGCGAALGRSRPGARGQARAEHGPKSGRRRHHNRGHSGSASQVEHPPATPPACPLSHAPRLLTAPPPSRQSLCGRGR